MQAPSCMRAGIFSHWEKLKKFGDDESVEVFAT